MKTQQKQQPHRLWSALEQVPGLAGVAAEWKALLGPEYAAVKGFLKLNGKQASSYLCPFPQNCGCFHEIITHTPDDIVAVCRCKPKRCDTIPLSKPDIAIYEIDRPKLQSAIASALHLAPDHKAVNGLHMTDRIGTYSPHTKVSFPVYLTIQIEPDDFQQVAERLLARIATPFILLATTPDLYNRECEDLLREKSVFLYPLSNIIALDGKGRFDVVKPIEEIFADFRGVVLPNTIEDGSKAIPPTLYCQKAEEVLVEFTKDGAGWHWIINGEEKWCLKKKESIALTISKILINQIGLGWIPHETFLNRLSRFKEWDTKRYFGEDGHKCKMQNHLNILRRNLGIEILFRKDKGVRFPENIVKSR